MKNDIIIVMVTCASKRQADAMLTGLLKKRLVACGNIITQVRSKFWWKGKIDSASESLLLLKTRRANFVKVDKEIGRMHSYDVPEIIALPVIAGSAKYIEWVMENVIPRSRKRYQAARDEFFLIQ